MIIGTVWFNEDTGDLVFTKSADWANQPKKSVRVLAKYVAALFEQIAEDIDESTDETAPETK